MDFDEIAKEIASRIDAEFMNILEKALHANNIDEDWQELAKSEKLQLQQYKSENRVIYDGNPILVYTILPPTMPDVVLNRFPAFEIKNYINYRIITYEK